jgi:xylan 1,4-beta-xylosidase
MPLSDDFSSPEIGIQWMYGRNVNPDEVFTVGNGKLIINGRGTSHRDAASISVMPVNHSYEVEAEISISDNSEGGILFSGRSREGSFTCAGVRRGELFARWSRLGNYLPWDDHKIHVRIRNNKFDVSCYYSKDGKHWIPFKRSTELTAVRRVSLYAAGEGEVEFRNFTYRGLD